MSVPNNRVVSVPDTIYRGAIWAETLTDRTGELTMEELIAFLEPTEERSGAVCMSSYDYARLKTALDQACELLGSRCRYDVPEQVRSIRP